MNRTQFKDICRGANLELVDGGRDWYDAEANGTYCCAVISNAADFAAISNLVDPDQVYYASAECKDGHAWYQHRGYGVLNGNAEDVSREMAEEFARFLSETNNDVVFYTESEIAKREQALLANPKMQNESDEDHLSRVAELQYEGWLVPSHVTKAGFWDSNSYNILLSQTQLDKGIWSYDYDNWHQSVLVVLIETDEIDEDEQD